MDKRFKIGDSELIISEELAKYNDLRYAFYEKADQAAEKFEAIYTEQNNSMKNLVDNFENQVAAAMKPVIEDCIKRLFEHGIYDIDTDSFMSRYYFKYITVMDRFEQYVDKYNDIVAANRDEHLYRAERKALRGRVVGGGFGLEGAAKGMAAAGAMNMASGVFHSIGNGIGNWFSNHEMNKKLDAVFNDSNTLFELKEALWESVFNIHYAYLDAVEGLTGKRIEKFSLDTVGKAEAICKNIQNIKPDFKQVESAICEMLMNNPYDCESYKMLIVIYGDENLQFQKIGEYFHINIDEIKILVLNVILDQFDITKTDNYEEIFRIIYDQAKHYGIPKAITDHEVSLLRRKRNQFELQETYSAEDRVYLDTKEDIRKFSEIKRDNHKHCRTITENLYNSYMLNDSLAYLGIGLSRKISNSQNYRNYLFIYGKADEDRYDFDEFIFGITFEAIVFSNKTKLDLFKVKTIEVSRNKLIVNHALCSRFEEKTEEQAKLLEKFLVELIRQIKSGRVEGVQAFLKLDNLFSEEGKASLTKTDQYIFKNISPLSRADLSLHVYDPYDPEGLINLKNILRKLSCLYQMDTISDPLFWCEDPGNKDDYWLLTGKALYSTVSGSNCDINRIGMPSADKENGCVFLNIDNENTCILKCSSNSADTAAQLIKGIITIASGQGEPEDIKNYTDFISLYNRIYPIAKDFEQELKTSGYSQDIIAEIESGFMIHTDEVRYKKSKHYSYEAGLLFDEDETALCSIKNTDVFSQERVIVTNKYVYYYIKKDGVYECMHGSLDEISRFEFLPAILSSKFRVVMTGDAIYDLYETVISKSVQPVFADVINRYFKRIRTEAIHPSDTSGNIAEAHAVRLDVTAKDRELACARENLTCTLRALHDVLEKAEIEKLCENLCDMDKEKLLALLSKLDAYGKENGETAKRKVNARIDRIETDLLDELTEDYEDMSREELFGLRKVIGNRGLRASNIRIYSDLILLRIQQMDENALEESCRDIDSLDKPAITALYNGLKGYLCASSVIDKYRSRMEVRFIQLDKAQLEKICPDTASLSFEEGLRLIDAVNKMDLRTEAKDPFIASVEESLMKLKRDEAGIYMNFLKSELHAYPVNALPDKISLYGLFGEPNTTFITASVRYANEIGKFEIPILLHDTTLLGGGEEGFLITPERIFFKGKTIPKGYLYLSDIVRFEAIKRMLSTELMIWLRNGSFVTVPNKLDKSQTDMLIVVLIKLLQMIRTNKNSGSNAIPQENPGMNPTPHMPGSTGLFCTKCGGSLTPLAKFCPACGNPVKLKCPGCGKDIQAGARFCGSCGYKLQQ